MCKTNGISCISLHPLLLETTQQSVITLASTAVGSDILCGQSLCRYVETPGLVFGLQKTPANTRTGIITIHMRQEGSSVQYNSVAGVGSNF